MTNRSATRSTSRSLLQSTAYVAVALLVLSPSMSLAADGSLTNELTGTDSQNTNTVTDTTALTATFGNTANVDNTFTLNLNTGGNTISNNTTVGDINTGSVTAEIESTTTVNEVDNDVLADLFDAFAGGSSVDGVNSTTGANSQNTNQVTNSRVFTFQQQNTLNVTNSINANITTGNNSVTDNTTVGNITTGDIDVDATVTTQGNTGGGFLPEENTDTNNPGPVTIAQLPPSQISAAPQVIAQSSTSPLAAIATGGGQFFPAGTDGQFGLQLVVFALAAIVLVRFQELVPSLFARLQHRPVLIRVQ